MNNEILKIKFGDLVVKLADDDTVFMPSKRSIILGHILGKIDFTGKTLLDVGCGSGIFSVIAAKNGAVGIVATDINPEALRLTKNNWGKNNLNTRLITIITDALNNLVRHKKWFGRFDFIVSNPPMLPLLFTGCSSKRHFRADLWNETPNGGRHVVDSLLRNSNRLLKPGGRLIFCHTSRIETKKTEKLLNKHFLNWKVIFKKELSLEDRFLPFVNFWIKKKDNIIEKDNKFFEIFSIIEAIWDG